MIYILLILFWAFAVLISVAYILGAALIGYALSKLIDNLSYKIVTTVRGKRK